MCMRTKGGLWHGKLTKKEHKKLRRGCGKDNLMDGGTFMLLSMLNTLTMWEKFMTEQIIFSKKTRSSVSWIYFCLDDIF
jgi:hypothetical protein